MLSEQITVTVTPTSIEQLIATARGKTVDDLPNVNSGVQMWYGSRETALVSMTDADQAGGSANGAVILDAQNEGITTASFEQSEISKVLLNCDTGTVLVHIVIPGTA